MWNNSCVRILRFMTRDTLDKSNRNTKDNTTALCTILNAFMIRILLPGLGKLALSLILSTASITGLSDDIQE